MSATFGVSLFISENAHGLLSLRRAVISSRPFDFAETSDLFSVFGPCPSLCSSAPSLHLADCLLTSYPVHLHFSEEMSRHTTFSVSSGLPLLVIILDSSPRISICPNSHLNVPFELTLQSTLSSSVYTGKRCFLCWPWMLPSINGLVLFQLWSLPRWSSKRMTHSNSTKGDSLTN